ncbi:MAG: hypothetical protein OK456_01565 [Thaumarchaeota archaeon]|nr:hypothetical protein [Nitrososphaerota archaeon]
MPTNAPRPAPRNWRRRMGTAILFLFALDALILFGPYGPLRETIAIVVSVAVLIAIAMIWRRNKMRENLSRRG